MTNTNTLAPEIEKIVRSRGLIIRTRGTGNEFAVCDKCALDSGLIALSETDEGLLATGDTWEPCLVETGPRPGDTRWQDERCAWCAQASMETVWDGTRWAC